MACGGTVTPPAPAVPLIAGATGPACFPMPIPFRKPAVDSVLDSVPVIAGLTDASASSGDSSTIALHFSPDGTLLRAIVVSGDPTVVILQTHSRVRRSRALWGVRVSVVNGPRPSLALKPSEYCPPYPVEQPGRVSHRDEIVTADEARRLLAAGPYRVNILVSEAGLPTQVVLSQSSGNDRQDAMILAASRARRFVPGRLDGVPVPAWYEVTPSQR